MGYIEKEKEKKKKREEKKNIKIRNTILGKTRSRSMRVLLVVFFLLYVLFAVDVMFYFSVPVSYTHLTLPTKIGV